MSPGKIVNLGQSIVFLNEALTGSIDRTVDFILQADLLLVAVYVRSVTGSVTIQVETFGQPGEDVVVATLGPFVVPTSDIQFSIANPTLANHKIRVLHTGACDLQVTGKGLSNSVPLNADGSIDVNVVSGAGSFSAATVGAIDTLDLIVAGTEYSYALPAGVKKFKIQNRNSGLLKLSYTTGFTTKYWTVFPGQQFGEDLILKTGLVLYLKSTSAAQTVEITAWS